MPSVCSSAQAKTANLALLHRIAGNRFGISGIIPNTAGIALVSLGGQNGSRRLSTKVPVERAFEENMPPFGLRTYLSALFPRE